MKWSGGRTKNLAELKMLGWLRKKGWSVLKKGWPDFLIYKQGLGGRQNKIKLVEVKKGKGNLSLCQKRMFTLLSTVLDCYQVNVSMGGKVKVVKFKP